MRLMWVQGDDLQRENRLLGVAIVPLKAFETLGAIVKSQGQATDASSVQGRRTLARMRLHGLTLRTGLVLVSPLSLHHLLKHKISCLIKKGKQK